MKIKKLTHINLFCLGMIFMFLPKCSFRLYEDQPENDGVILEAFQIVEEVVLPSEERNEEFYEEE